MYKEQLIDELIETADPEIFEQSLDDMFLAFVEDDNFGKGQRKDDGILFYVTFRKLIRDLKQVKR